MASRRQLSFQFPLLFELAVRSGVVDTRHRPYQKSDDLIEMRKSVFSYFAFTEEQKRRVRKDGKTNYLDNEHDYASHVLKEAGDLKRVKNVRWKITERGLCKLQSAFGRLLRKTVDATTTESLLSTEDENGDELLLAAMKRVPVNALEYLVLGCSSRRELFLLAFSNISSDRLGGFLASGYEGFRDLVLQHGEKLRRLYERTPSSALLRVRVSA